MSTIQQGLPSQIPDRDTSAPGLTRMGPGVIVTPLDKNPLGPWTPPAPSAFVSPGNLAFQEISISVTPSRIALGEHEHVSFDNQGIVTIQASKDGSTWYNFLPAGRVMVLDFHKEKEIFFKTAAGVAVILIATW